MSVLAGMGATLADEVEYVAKSEFDLLVHELDEAKAELANLKMMVQGLGFAGARTLARQPRDRDPSHSDPFPVTAISESCHRRRSSDRPVMGWAGRWGEPVVTVKEADAQ
jgi:hypothetical protein